MASPGIVLQIMLTKMYATDYLKWQVAFYVFFLSPIWLTRYRVLQFHKIVFIPNLSKMSQKL